MKTYKFSDLVHKRSEVMAEAEKDGVILQRLETNSILRDEFVLIKKGLPIDVSDTIDVTDTINKV